MDTVTSKIGDLIVHVTVLGMDPKRRLYHLSRFSLGLVCVELILVSSKDLGVFHQGVHM